jgi:anti-sigma B factor antagonist
MSLPAGRSATSERAVQLTVVETSRASADHAPRALSGRVDESSDLGPFAVGVQRRDHATIVQPRGELDLATIDTLRSALDAAIAEALQAELSGIDTCARLVLDLRGLSFIDSNGLHLLVTLDERAQRDGFQLTLLAPAAPIDRAIQLCGLDQVLPFVAPDALEHEPAKSASDPQDGS